MAAVTSATSSAASAPASAAPAVAVVEFAFVVAIWRIGARFVVCHCGRFLRSVLHGVGRASIECTPVKVKVGAGTKIVARCASVALAGRYPR